MILLPSSWSNYDLIVSASMMEYLPHERLVDALAGLRERLNADGSLLLFVTKRNWLMRPLIGCWWDANLYTAGELESPFCPQLILKTRNGSGSLSIRSAARVTIDAVVGAFN